MSQPISDAPEGILLVDKPQGITSHDVVSKIRRVYHMKKVGHAGTLDPMATGLLLILIGKATKFEHTVGSLLISSLDNADIYPLPPKGYAVRVIIH